MFKLGQVLPGNNPYDQEVCGMSGIEPTPFQAISYLPNSSSRQALGILDGELFQPRDLRRNLDRNVGHQDLRCRSVYSDYPDQAYSVFERGKSSPLRDVFHEIHALTVRVRRACIHLSKSTCLPVFFQEKNVFRIHGNSAHLPSSRSDISSCNAFCIFQNKISDGNESQAFPFHTLYRDVQPIPTSAFVEQYNE